MPKTLICPVCQTWHSGNMSGLGGRCPACGGRFQAVNPPVIYWRVVGVALATAVLFVITTIFALKVWADGKRSAGSDPGKAREESVQPVTTESRLAPERKSKGSSQPTDSLFRPETIPARPQSKHAKQVMVAEVEKAVPSGFN